MAAIQFQVQRELAVTADRLWPVLGRFSRLPDWFPGITGFRCSGDAPGARRDITLGPFQVTQELLSQDDDARRTVYQIIAGPGMDRGTGFVVTITLEARGEHCHVCWGACLDALPAAFPPGSEAAFTERTRRNYEQALDHLEGVIARWKNGD
jgi:carbon monoxide dehydrogenase subunit G